MCVSVKTNAQPTNREVMVSLVTSCLAPAVDSSTAISYTYHGSESFIETGIVSSWLSDGRTVSVHDNDSMENHLEIHVTDLAVNYTRLSRKSVSRTVTAAVMATLKSSDNEILEAVNCPGSFDDVLDRRKLVSVEDSQLPVTAAPHPSSGIIRKYIQPVIVGAASAVTVYLFFSIRSSNDSSSP